MNINEVKKGRRIVGTMIRFSRNSGICQIAKAAGLDFLMYDMEHGDYSLETFSDAARLARSIDLGILVRVPELSKAWVSRVMDLGADGVMVPMISSREEAEKLVAWSRYVPLGKRGLSTVGPHTSMVRSPQDVEEFMDQQNRNTLVIAQIETSEGVNAINEIASVPGLDVLLIGPNDLAVSLGVPGDLTGSEVGDAIGQVADAAEKNDKIFAMHAGGELMDRWITGNMGMVMSNMDIHILYDGLRDIARKFKN
ncbi:MAG: aldolase/citrate lyase family protein [Spirochaetales bacterium]|nr:aldolase/citrate lyase family protein [Spirochaetales bacterium]